MEEYEKLISTALKQLHSVALKMSAEDLTKPLTREPRPKIFEIAPGIFWPDNRHETRWQFYYVSGIEPGRFLGFNWSDNAKEVLEHCKYQPRLILRALHQIQAATAWCDARIEGRRRAAEEIMRQQAAAIETLDAEVAMAAMAE